MKKFSTFNNVKETEPSPNITAKALIRFIKGDTYKDTCDAIRRAPDKDTRSALKATLPAVTASGRFSKRSISALLEHSGILIADLDLDDNEQLIEEQHMAATRARLCADSMVHFLFKSPSGGLKVGVKIDATDSATHKAAFITVRDWFLDTHGLVIDAACSDVSRLCFLSHDTEACYQADSETFKTVEAAVEALPFWQAKTTSAAGEKTPGDDFNQRGDVEGMLTGNGWTTRTGDNGRGQARRMAYPARSESLQIGNSGALVAPRRHLRRTNLTTHSHYMRHFIIRATTRPRRRCLPRRVTAKARSRYRQRLSRQSIRW